MTFISVAQYASSEDTKKTAEAVFFVFSRKGFMRLFRLFQSSRV